MFTSIRSDGEFARQNHRHLRRSYLLIAISIGLCHQRKLSKFPIKIMVLSVILEGLPLHSKLNQAEGIDFLHLANGF